MLHLRRGFPQILERDFVALQPIVARAKKDEWGFNYSGQKKRAESENVREIGREILRVSGCRK